MLKTGYHIRAIQELLGHKDVRRTPRLGTAMIYLHILNIGDHGVLSPAEGVYVDGFIQTV